MVSGIRQHTRADLHTGIPTKVCRVRDTRCSPSFPKGRTGLRMKRSEESHKGFIRYQEVTNIRESQEERKRKVQSAYLKK